MSKFCLDCQREVTPVRNIGVGTLLIILFTVFSWIFVVPFYPKRCPICKGLNFKEDKLPASAPARELTQEEKNRSAKQLKIIGAVLAAAFIVAIIILKLTK